MENIDLTDQEIKSIVGQEYSRTQRPTILRENVNKLTDRLANINKNYVEKYKDMIYKKEWVNHALIRSGMNSFISFTNDEYDRILEIIENLNEDPINPIKLKIYNQIYELYVNSKLTINEISEHLNISNDSISNILIENKIPRFGGSTYRIYDPDLLRIHRQIRYYCPDFVRLEKDSIKIIGPDRLNIKIAFSIAKKESIKYQINSRDTNYNWAPIIVPEYEDCDLEKDFVHWRVKTKFNNKLETRVASMRLVKFCRMSADKHPRHPEYVINNIKDNYKLMLYNKNFWKVVEHFFGNEEIKYYSGKPRQLLHVITDCQDENDFSTSNTITKVLYHKRLKVDVYSLDYIYTILKNSSIKSIYDPNPGIGTLMAACSILNIDYHFDDSNDYIFRRGIENGILEFYNNRFKKLENEKYDVCMSLNLPVSWYKFMNKNSDLNCVVADKNSRQLVMQNYNVELNQSLFRKESLILFKSS